MGDLLVKLYDLPEVPSGEGLHIKRPLVPEKRLVVSWVEGHFGERWAGEVEVAFASHPVTCFVALNEAGQLSGFACYDTTFKGFFGPMGVEELSRGRGIGTALLLRCLESMRESGYAYAVIGYAGAGEYYRKIVGATPIEGSEPGAYGGWIER
jgi:GNAT superfamily N-acetyltransferase